MNNAGAYGYQPRTAAVVNNIPVGVDKIPKDCKKVNTYYSRYNGSKYYFSDGGTATFWGGKYEIDAANPRNALRVEELEYVVDNGHQPIFSRVPVRIIKSDSKRMRAIDRASDGVQAEEEFDEDQNMGDPPQLSGVGMVNSQTVNVISANSNTVK